VLDLSDLDTVIARSEGVTASFIKELLRRAALQAAEAEDQEGEQAREPLRVTDAHMTAALDQLLDTRSALTQALLGGTGGTGGTRGTGDTGGAGGTGGTGGAEGSGGSSPWASTAGPRKDGGGTSSRLRP
jgi:hypothetical protein